MYKSGDLVYKSGDLVYKSGDRVYKSGDRVYKSGDEYTRLITCVHVSLLVYTSHYLCTLITTLVH